MSDKQNENHKNNLSSALDMLPELSNAITSGVIQSGGDPALAISSAIASFAGSRIENFIKEIKEDKEIDTEILSTSKSTSKFIDLIDFASKESPVDDVWNAAKTIFARAMRKDLKEKERDSLFDLIDVCKQLDGAEIKILAGCYKISKDKTISGNSVQSWSISVSKEVGFHSAHQVLRHEDKMVEQKLISPREDYKGGTMNSWTLEDGNGGHRLTSLGFELAKILHEEEE